jgi:NAD(P)H-hydrate epimerase
VRLATVSQSRRIDQLAQSDYALPGDVLMEAAGSLAAREITQSFIPELKRGRVAIVCGPGNNGGDGLVVAKHLHSAGHRDVAVFLVAPGAKRSALFREQLDRCVRQGVTIGDLIANPAALEAVRASAIIIDAIFGTGLGNEVEQPYRNVIAAMNESSAPIVSLDVPSGLDADRGMPLGVAVRAHQTICFGPPKPGFFVSEGPSHVGQLKALSIGFPRELVRKTADSHFAFTEKLAHRFLPKRSAGSNKARHGHALIFAGSEGMWGAGLLSASAAYRMGCGYVTLASHEEPLEILRDTPEILTTRADNEALWKHRKWTAVAIGPGLGTGENTYRLIRRLIDEAGSVPVIVDADALTVIAERKIASLPPMWVLTPHAGEMKRLINVDSKDIEADRFRYSREAAEHFGCHVLLKGYRTVVTGEGKSWVATSGNSALAKAGTGDVLTGMICSLAAQGLSTLKASATAAYVHGRIADEWVRAGNSRGGLNASDLRAVLPQLLSRLRP